MEIMKLTKIIITILIIISLHIPGISNANLIEGINSMVNKIETTAHYITYKNNNIPPFLPYFYAYLIHYFADEYQIRPIHLTAIISIESTFYNYAVSSADCIGLGQINPKVWTKTLKKQGIIKKKKDLYKPDRNIEATAYILRHYYNKEIKLNKKNPLEYAVNRYLGADSHYKRFIKEIKHYHTWLESIDK
jgi:soluble lytic murein transglycosylase-like protein